MDFYLGLMSWTETLPRWQRPVINGATLVVAFILSRAGGLIGLALVFGVIWWQGGLAEAVRGLLVLPAAVAAGAIGGCAYVVVSPLRWIGRPGVWLSWVCASGAYLLSIARLLGALFPEEQSFLLHHLADAREPAFMITLGIMSLWAGSLGFWAFGSEDDLAVARSQPSARGLLVRAIEDDLSELRDAAKTDSQKQRELAQVLSAEPSTATVMHWWRVVGRLAREHPAAWDWPPQWALHRAQAHLHRAQRRWNAVQQRRARGDA